MIKKGVFLILFFISNTLGISQTIITTDYKNLNRSIANRLSIHEDPSGEIEIDDILKGFYEAEGRPIRNAR